MDPSEIEIVPAPSRLQPFIRRYMYANRQLATPLTVRPKPTGYSYFANCFGSSSFDFIGVDGEQTPRRTRFHLPGQIVDHDIVIHHRDRHEVLYCELSATGLYRLFGVPGDRTTGKAPPLVEIGNDFEAMACEHFRRGPEGTRDEHIDEANGFFDALAERALPGNPLVEAAVASFERAHGAVRVADVCKQLSVEPRRLNRLFTHIIGVSPKFFGQILQINWVVGLLYSNDTATLTEIAHEAGFYDQSHFHRAMQRFFQEGPSDFLRSDHILFKEFLGKSRRFGPTSTDS